MVMEYLEEERDEFGHRRLFHKFKYQAYWTLTFEEKTALLAWLVSRAVESESTRAEIFAAEDGIEDLQRELKEKVKLTREKFKKIADEVRASAKKGSAASSAGAAPSKPPEEVATKSKSKSAASSGSDEEDEEDEEIDSSSSESSSEEQEPPKTIGEVQQRLEKRLRRLQEEYEDLAKPPTIRILPLGSDRFHNRYWWFGNRRSGTGKDTKEPVRRSKRRQNTPLSSAETRVFVEYYPGNVAIKRPVPGRGERKILRDPTFDEYISSETEDDSDGDTKSPWATSSTDLAPAPNVSSSVTKAILKNQRADRARRRGESPSSSSSLSEDSGSDSDDAGSEDSNSEEESSSSSSSVSPLVSGRRARPKSLKDVSSVSSSPAESDFDESGEEEDDENSRGTGKKSTGRGRGGAAKKRGGDDDDDDDDDEEDAQGDDAMSVDEDSDEDFGGRSSRASRARICTPSPFTVS